MKKIAIITNSHLGEDPRLFYKIGNTLSKEYKVFILSPKVYSQKSVNPKLIRLNEKKKIEVLKEIYQKLKLIEPDKIICVEPITMLVGILFKRKRDVELIYDCHEFFASAFAQNRKLKPIAHQFYKKIENFLIKRMDKVLTVNDVLAKRLKEANSNVEVFGNFPILKEKNTNTAEKKYDFVYIGGISEAKGMIKILKAVNSLKNLNIKVLFIGRFLDENSQDYFDKFIKSEKLEENIFYIGEIPHSEIDSYLQQSKFGLSFLSPKVERYKYAIPLKLLEYLQSGLPVITNNFRILDDVIQKDKNGFQIEFNTISLKKIFKKAINIKEDEYKKMVLASKKIIETKYNWNLGEERLLNSFSKKNKVLLLAYFFPPLGGPGVQRPCKMVKYFSRNGIKTDVISVRDLVYHSFDEKMVSECNADNVYRTSSLDPMSFLKKFSKNSKTQKNIYFNTSDKLKNFVRSSFPIDDKIGWFPAAYSKAKELCRKNNYKAVIATMGPYTSGVIAYKISKKFNIPLVLDYRDHWCLNPYLNYLTPFHNKFNLFVEKKMIESASLITIFSKFGKKELLEFFNNIEPKKILPMYNGWDEDDFENLNVSKKSNEKFIFSYIGNFYGLRTVKYLLQAINELKSEGKLPENILFRFIGNYYKRERELLLTNKYKEFIEIIPQVNHEKALEYLLKTDALLLFISSETGKGEITGKIFEYITAQKEILAMIPPNGEAAEILKEANHEFISPMENVDEIKKNLLEIYSSKNKTREYKRLVKYSRRIQYQQLLEKMESRL